MIERFDALLERYEKGTLGRRQFLLGLAALSVASGAEAQSGSSTFEGRVVNHVTLGVADIERSRAFYEELFGATTLAEVTGGVDVRVGDSFIGLYSMRQSGVIDHFSIGVRGFEADAALQRLEERHAETEPYGRTNSLGQKEVYLSDPDGIRVQVSAPDYKLG